MDNRVEKLQAAVMDRTYAKELMALENLEDIQAKLAEKDIILTMEETEELVNQVVANLGDADGELSEESLETVAGGNPLVGMAIVLGCIIVGVVIGWVAAGGCNKKNKKR